MTTPRLITVFGATGNQCGSVVDVVLADPVLRQKYKLRGITRNISSHSAESLSQRGVEMVAATLNDVASLRTAIRGSYGVFGMTNFWDKDAMSKEIEIQQGKSVFEACKAEGVTHYVFSTLPHAEKLTVGTLTRIEHFDGKAMVAEYVEANKGEMLASYFLPAMYMKSYKDQVKFIGGIPTMIMPFVAHDMESATWLVIDPRANGGKFVMGLFEGDNAANGVKAHAVSQWMSPLSLLERVSLELGQQTVLKAVTPETLSASLPDNIAEEITQTMLLVGNYSYYGRGEEKTQKDSDQWLVKGTEKMSLEQVVQGSRPWGLT